MISEELKRIKEAKDALKISINNKGVEVTDADSISVYASKVDLIVTGSTIEMQSIDITENGKYENTSIPYSSVTVNVDDGSARIKELEDEIVDLNSQITQKQNKIDELQNKLDYDEDLIEDLRNEIASLESQKSALENELNELKSKVNSMTDLTVSENGTYTPSFGYKSVTVNVPQTGSDITLTEITITDVGEYTAPEKIAYNKILVPSETFYKKYTDGEGNTYIINEDGEIVVTYTGSTPPTPTDEYIYITVYIPSDKAYSSITSNYLAGSAFTEVYFDGEPYDYNQSWGYYIRRKPIEPNTYHIIKARLVNDNDTDSIDKLTYFVLNEGVAETSGNPEVHKIQYAYGTTKIEKLGNTSRLYVKEIVMPNTVINIDGAFWLYSGLTSVTMSDLITSIGKNTFRGCSILPSITIPISVVSIGDDAFDNCTSLTSINYNGTKAQFTAITKGYWWKYNVPTSCIVHCTDGDYPITDFS